MDLDVLDLGENQWSESRMCDGCEYHFTGNEYAAVYFCDQLWLQGEHMELPGPIAEEMYCLNCYNDEVPLPHLGTNEGFYLVSMKPHTDEDTVSYEKEKLLRGSPEDDGVDWDPPSLIDEFLASPIEAMNFAITPAYTFNIFYRQGVDLRGFVKDGEIKIPSSVTEQLGRLTDITLRNRRDLRFRPEDLDEL